jgi:hypothetical protein
MLDNVTKEYKMRTLTDKAYILGMGILATFIIYFAWDNENAVPVFQFAIAFGGVLLGHVLTIVLDDTTNEKEEG